MGSTTDTWLDGKITVQNLDGSNGFWTEDPDLKPSVVETSQGSTLQSVGDINGDGFEDFISTSPASGQALVYLGNGGTVSLRFLIESLQPNSSLGSYFGSQDINGDGYNDIFLFNSLASGYWIYGHANSSGEGDSGANTLTGANGDDVLTGFGGNDTLDGGLRNDILYGGAGRDTLIGGGGDDFLDGGAGRDTMRGGAGNDRYIVATPGDLVSENAGEGYDTVIAGVDYTLGADVEALVLRGAAITGTGNDGANRLTGNALANTLKGLAGDDTIYGFDGGDTIDGGEGADRLYGGAGSDTISGGDDADTLSGGAGDDWLDGGAMGDDLYGGVGNDTIVGGGGVDALLGGAGDDVLVVGEGDGAIGGGDFATGGAGADVFRVSALFDAGMVTLTDFAEGVDTLDLSLVDADSMAPDDQAFHWGILGADGAGTLAWQIEPGGGSTYLLGDVDGDGIADLVIDTQGVVIPDASIVF